MGRVHIPRVGAPTIRRCIAGGNTQNRVLTTLLRFW